MSRNQQTETKGNEMSAAYARVTGDTYRHREALKSSGYRWTAAAQAWIREVTSEANLAKLVAATTIPWADCCREVLRGATLLARTYGPQTKASAQRMGCDGCGDDVPAKWTPQGWLCADCRRNH
jgi:hypothetical protein